MNAGNESDPRGCLQCEKSPRLTASIDNSQVKYSAQPDLPGDSLTVTLVQLHASGGADSSQAVANNENRHLDISLSDHSEQLNQGIICRRHSVDSSIGRSRPPTFIRTYREVKWKRVNAPSKFPQVSQSSDLENQNTVDTSLGKDGESRDYITGTHIIRQRVPIFMANSDPPGVPCRRFSAGDLIPITGSGLCVPPNGRCLVIRDMLPSKLTLSSSGDSLTTNASSSSLEDVSYPSSSIRNGDIYEFTLIDEDEEDEEASEDISEEDEEEERESKTENTTTGHVVVSLSASSSQSSVHTVSLSPSTQKMGTLRSFDLRRLAFENSIQRKNMLAQSPANTPAVVSAQDVQSSSLLTLTQGTTHSVVVSATTQVSLMPGVGKSALTPSLVQSFKSPVTTANTGIPDIVPSKMQPVVMSTTVMYSKTQPVVMSPTVMSSSTQPVVMSTNTHSSLLTDGPGQVVPHKCVFCGKESGNKLLEEPKSSGSYLQPSDQSHVPRRSLLKDTSLAVKSNKKEPSRRLIIYRPPQSSLSFRRSHFISPFIVERTIPIDLQDTRDIHVERVIVPTTSGDPLVFQRVTYSSGYICCSAKWIAPPNTKANDSRSSSMGTLSSGKPAVQQSDSVYQKNAPTATTHSQVTGMSDTLLSVAYSQPPHAHPSLSDMADSLNPSSAVTSAAKDDLSSQEVVPSLTSTVMGHTSSEQSACTLLTQPCHDNLSVAIQCPSARGSHLSPSITRSPTPVTRKWTFVIEDLPDGYGNTDKVRDTTMSIMSTCKNAPLEENNLTVISTQARDYHLNTREVRTECGSHHALVSRLVQPEEVAFNATDTSSHGTQVKDSWNIYTSGPSHTKLTVTEKTLLMAVADVLKTDPISDSRNHEAATPTSSKQFDLSQCADMLSKSTQELAGSDSELSPFTDSIESSDAVSGNSTLSDSHTRDKTESSMISAADNELLQIIMMSLYGSEENTVTPDRRGGGSSVAIDNKIEQAMDLVKRHLMYAVREEVEILKQQIGEMVERIGQLEYENTVLRSEAKPDTLNKLLQPRVTQTTAANLQQPQQVTSQVQPSQQVVHPTSQQQASQTVQPQAVQPSS